MQMTINRAMHSTAVHVGEKLQQQECLLLLSVHQTFSFLVSEVAHASNLHVGVKVTARWLLSNLVVCLQHYISYTCRVRTPLYRSNGDVLASLSHLLYKYSHGRSDHGEKANTGTCTSTVASPAHVTLDEINSRVHQQIQKFLAADLNTPYPFDALNIDKLASEMDPQLWAFICSITQSISECKGYNVKTN